MTAKTGTDLSLDRLAIDTIRTLSIDAVEKAKSGHPGAPMALAPVAYTLWSRFLRYDPADPAWPNRDRFVLSAGHASMLIYSLLHMAGVAGADRAGKPLNRPAVSLDDIKAFRTLGSNTAGHPEYGLTTGVETTTGPLGQGVANSVGMAMAQGWLAARHPAAGFDYNVYALCSDGDLMEGVAAEAASMAGYLKLSNLCWIWDDNEITIEGGTDISVGEDIAARFRAYGWATQKVDDANDCEAFARAVQAFEATTDRPTLIQVRSIIGYGSTHQGTSDIHSDPLGPEEVKLTKAAYGWPTDEHFRVPAGVAAHLNGALAARVAPLKARWQAALAAYAETDAAGASQLDDIFAGRLPAGWESAVPVYPADPKGMATRDASGKVLNALGAAVPWLIGGSADLAPSNKTRLTFDGAGDFGPEDYSGRNIHFGVREHLMGSIANGMAVSGLRPYTGTFLIFSDYMRPPQRLAALMELPVVFVFTHDSIGVGQDGPTHQPIEQLAALRAMPDMLVFRPCDANETAQAWRLALAQTHRPSSLSLTRQALPTLDRMHYGAAEGVARGGYVLDGSSDKVPAVILIASGSEVSLCLEAHATLTAEGVACRVVSMPCWELFAEQDRAYRDAVLPPNITARVAVETGSPLGWERFTGLTGEIIAMHRFGASAPFGDLLIKYGFTAENVLAAARRQLKA